MDDQQLQAARIKYQIRRGMLELDSMLRRFYDQQYAQLSAKQKVIFEKLLEESDQDLWRWLLGLQDVDNEDFKSMVELIQQSQ